MTITRNPNRGKPSGGIPADPADRCGRPLIGAHPRSARPVAWLFSGILLWLWVAPAATLASSSTLLLDGPAERVVVAHDPLLNPSDAVTIEAWVRPNSVSGCQTIVGKNYTTGYWLGLCSGQIRSYTRGSLTQRTGSRTLTTGTWWHVAMSFDGTTRRHYLNGELEFSESTPGLLANNAAPLGIGGEGAAVGGFLFPFTGRISEVRIWNSARTIDQIRRGLYRQATSPEPGLVAAWALEGSPADRFGHFESTLAPGAGFSALDSPPLPHDPLRIRALTGAITTDGVCTDPGYQGAISLPNWYRTADLPGSSINPLITLAGANGSYLYLCFLTRTQFSDRSFEVTIDTANDRTFLPNADDYRFRFTPGVGMETSRGAGLNGVWEPASNPSGLLGTTTVAAEFYEAFEIRIPRTIFPSADAVFGLRANHTYVSGGITRRAGWPNDFGADRPREWQQSVIDLSPVGRADSANPNVTAAVDNARVRFFEQATIRARGVDDVDVELIEILVDDAVVQSCDFLGLDDRSVNCNHVASYPVGNHLFHARIYDHAGRMHQTPRDSFRVLVDGDSPRVTLRVDPPNPAAGQTVTISARARDPAGIQSIRIRDILGVSFPSFQHCDFDGSSGNELCSWVFTPAPGLKLLRVSARATDAEGFSSETASRVILFGNSGVDSDGDGLADHIESALCTSALNPDTDGDGLSDGWELVGIPFANGSFEPLVDYGASPCWKNALLQLDYETGARPPAAGVDNLRNRYRQHGIALHIEMNERPRPTAYPQSHLGAESAVYQSDEDGFWFSPGRQWAFYYGYQRNLPGRSGAWGRFFTIDHLFGSSGFCMGGTNAGNQCSGDFQCGGGGTCAAGCSDGTRQGLSCTANTQCPKPDGDFAVCTAPCTAVPTPGFPLCNLLWDTDYRLLHELGHSVGLGHGGRTGTRAATASGGFVQLDNHWDSRNYKPNHQSAMNYLYNRGELCMEPIPAIIPDGFSPTLVGLLTYSNDSLGDLNENALSEHPFSAFASNLRTRDCSHASATAVPVVHYTCKSGEVQYEVISNGSRPLMRRPRDGDWDYSPPQPPTNGIDWNCNGVIDAGTVAQNINAVGWFAADSFWDEGAWILEDQLRGQAEWPNIPNPAGCQILYRANCDVPADSCYPWPASYRSAIPSLASGRPPIDCRDTFLANREGACAAIAASAFSTQTCPLVDPDTPVSAALAGKVQASERLIAKGVAPQEEFDSDQFREVNENERTRPVPGLEWCDLRDNDGDGLVDEGCRDTDSDGVPDVVDNCETVANADQADRDGDGLGDACQFPTVSGVTASFDGVHTVTVSWQADPVPNRGYVLYRYALDQPNAVHLGASYPSTTGLSFQDTVGAPGTYTYAVRALNLNGVEGEPAMGEVVVDTEALVFGDSFED